MMATKNFLFFQIATESLQPISLGCQHLFDRKLYSFVFIHCKKKII